MKDKKIIILAVLSVFALVSLARGIMAPAKYKGGAAVMVSAGQPVTAQGAGNASMQRRAKRTNFKYWKRNPFVPASSGTSSALALNGIIWNKDRPKAMIGDAIVVKGDSVNGNKVVDIKPDRVILNDGVSNFELKMEK
jgi:hypothetical protein